ncbi:4-alpha-glucanotransferase [Luteolibacter algae]|uniref:4-alpha-glucanotransferase n=1 Tax=Luteolibacter algae TaxID=454151 RepID=A0ABW5D6F3_9BACT
MNQNPLKKRRAGLLAPVFAMRHEADFGTGDTRAVREAIGFCAENRFEVLQLLPIHETFGDHSPYNPISSRALSPAFVYLDPSEVPGLQMADIESAAPAEWRAELRANIVKHGAVHPLKIQILLRAWHHFVSENDPALQSEFQKFIEDEKSWLHHYTLFRLLIREYEGNTDWKDWRPEHRNYGSAEHWLENHPDRADLEDQRQGYAYIQWIAQRQWLAVRSHAEQHGIFLMGEISFGVGRGSSDVWANPKLFDTDWNMGTRPLAHFDTSKDASVWGQNWGLPPYRWENHRAEGFSWFRGRIARQRKFFHLCRLDHLRGYFRVYVFPWPGGSRHSEYANLTAEEAALKTGGKLPRFLPGPDEDPVSLRINEKQGRELISIIQEEAGPMGLVAEIMGEMPEYMSRALEELQLANLAFPQLERHSGKSDAANLKLRELALATYANHDNAPLATGYVHLVEAAGQDPKGKAAEDLRWLLAFAGWKSEPPAVLTEELLEALHQALFHSESRLAVLMCSDLFGIPLRFNLPGSYGIETWCERLPLAFPDFKNHPVFGEQLRKIRKLILDSERSNSDQQPDT